MKLNITKEQALKILKTAAYVAISAVLGFLISVVTDQPELFGVFAPIINVVLVTLKQTFTEPKN